MQKITGSTVEDLTITADVRSTSADTASNDLKKCVRQGRYAGRVTDVRGGVLYVRLNNGVNAIAHSCYDRRTPGKGDDVSFSVTRLDEEQGVAVGLIRAVDTVAADLQPGAAFGTKKVCIPDRREKLAPISYQF